MLNAPCFFTTGPEHVASALSVTNPSTLRESAIEVPNVSWASIGGTLLYYLPIYLSIYPSIVTETLAGISAAPLR